MIPKQYLNLISQLLKRSNEDDVHWRRTASSNEYLVMFDNYSLSVRHGEPDEFDPEEYIVFVIRDSKGNEVDRFFADKGDEEFSICFDLYSAARRKGLGIDEALNEILSDLENSSEVGRKEEDDIPF